LSSILNTDAVLSERSFEILNPVASLTNSSFIPSPELFVFVISYEDAEVSMRYPSIISVTSPEEGSMNMDSLKFKNLSSPPSAVSSEYFMRLESNESRKVSRCNFQ